MKVARTSHTNHHTSKVVRGRHTLATLLPITDSKSAPVNVERKDVIEILTEDEDEDEDVVRQLAAKTTEDTEDRKSTRLNSSHSGESRMPSSA